MRICEWCGKEIDETLDCETFEMETVLCWQNLRKCLCGDCAVQAIHEEVNGVYYETCERCGKTFDYIEEIGKFDSYFSYCGGTTLRHHWRNGILCSDCAIDDAERN